MLERRQQGEDLHVHHPGRRVGHCQRTVAEARETGQRVVVAGRRGVLPGGRGLAANSPSCVLMPLGRGGRLEGCRRGGETVVGAKGNTRIVPSIPSAPDSTRTSSGRRSAPCCH